MISVSLLAAVVAQLERIDKCERNRESVREQFDQCVTMLCKERTELMRLYTTVGKQATDDDFPCIVSVPHHSMRYLLDSRDRSVVLVPIANEIAL